MNKALDITGNILFFFLIGIWGFIKWLGGCFLIMVAAFWVFSCFGLFLAIACYSDGWNILGTLFLISFLVFLGFEFGQD